MCGAHAGFAGRQESGSRTCYLEPVRWKSEARVIRVFANTPSGEH